MDSGQDITNEQGRRARRALASRLPWILGLIAGVAIGAAAAFGLVSV